MEREKRVDGSFLYLGEKREGRCCDEAESTALQILREGGVARLRGVA